jgi:hypothetical protein
MRNTFVHNVDEVPGWDLDTKQGRKITNVFVRELCMLAAFVTGVFVTLPAVRAKMDLGKEVTGSGAHQRARNLLEKHFGSVARKILEGRYRRPVLVHSKESSR